MAPRQEAAPKPRSPRAPPKAPGASNLGPESIPPLNAWAKPAKLVRASTGRGVGRDIGGDERVSVAALLLAAELNDDVYMWCERPLSPREALGAIAQDVGWEPHQDEFAAAPVTASAARLFGVRVRSPARRSGLGRSEVLAQLERAPSSLSERVACAFRYVRAGGYFVDHGADPARPPSRAFDPSQFGVVDTSQSLLESFCAETIWVYTRRDLAGAVGEAAVARYRLGAGAGAAAAQRAAALGARTRALFSPPDTVREQALSLTYLKLAGPCAYLGRGADPLVAAFAAMSATESMPLVRLGIHSLGTVVTRAHKGFADAGMFGVSGRRDFLQAVLRLPGAPGGAHALLEIFPDKYYLSARFPARDGATTELVAGVFPAANEVLASVSPHYVPLDGTVFRAPYAGASAGAWVPLRAFVVDMWVSAVLVSRRQLCAARDFYRAAAAGGAVLVSVNSSRDERKTFLQYLRSDSVSREALVRSFMAYNASVAPALLVRRIVADYGVSAEEAAGVVREFREYSFVQVPRVCTVRVDRQSSSRAVLRIEMLQDVRYAHRVVAAVRTLLAECSTGRRVPAEQAIASADVVQSLSQRVHSRIGEVDEFIDMINISESGSGASFERAPATEAGETIAGRGSDVLRALQARAPDVFGFRSTGVFRPYSVQCQDRQPVGLDDAEMDAARRGSSRGSFEGSVSYAARGHAQLHYVCPQRWCVTSGVARRRGERCPLVGEPVWDFGDAAFPGFISSAKHPDGLCMPCCFRKRPLPGSKLAERISECESGGKDGDGGAGAAYSNKHLSREQRILDSDALGRVPAAAASVLPDGAVRVGMGARPTFFAAVGRILNEAGVERALAGRMQYHHFLAGDPRRYISRGGPAGPGAAGPEFRRWWASPESRGYREALGLVGGRAPTRAMVGRDAAAFASFRALRERIDPDDGSDAWLRPLNASAPASAPHIMVLIASDGGGIGVSPEEPRAELLRNGVGIVLRRGDRYEPIGVREPGSKMAPRMIFSAEDPLVAELLRRQAPIIPEVALAPDAVRLLASTFVVTAVAFGRDVMALARPVPFDARWAHAHAGDFLRKTARPSIAGERIRAAAAQTGDSFYTTNAADATRTILSTALVDEMVAAGGGVADRRTTALAEVNARAEAEARHASAVWAAIRDDPAIRDAEDSVGGEARDLGELIRDLRTRRARDLPKLEPHVLDYLLERLLRPASVAALPFFEKKVDEIVVASIK